MFTVPGSASMTLQVHIYFCAAFWPWPHRPGSDASLAPRTFNEIKSLGAAVAQAHTAGQNVRRPPI